MKYATRTSMLIMLLTCGTNIRAAAGAADFEKFPQEVEDLCMSLIIPSVESLKGRKCERTLKISRPRRLSEIRHIDQPLLSTPVGGIFREIATKGFSATLVKNETDWQTGLSCFNNALLNQCLDDYFLKAKKTGTLHDWKYFHEQLHLHLSEYACSFDSNLSFLAASPFLTVYKTASAQLKVKRTDDPKDDNLIDDNDGELPLTAQNAFKIALLAMAVGFEAHLKESPKTFAQFANYMCCERETREERALKEIEAREKDKAKKIVSYGVYGRPGR